MIESCGAYFSDAASGEFPAAPSGEPPLPLALLPAAKSNAGRGAMRCEYAVPMQWLVAYTGWPRFAATWLTVNDV